MGDSRLPHLPDKAPSTATPTVADKNKVCALKGGIYGFAASARDLGLSPQDTFARAKAMNHEPTISDDYLKKAINQVYFDSGFANAGGPPLQVQVASACAAGQPIGFAPLK
jgi:hypothetical protein